MTLFNINIKIVIIVLKSDLGVDIGLCSRGSTQNELVDHIIIKIITIIVLNFDSIVN